MHIPPYHKKKNWQLFIIGIFTGSIIAYLLFIFMYGKMYGNILTDYIELNAQYEQLTRQHETLLSDQEQLQQEAKLSIQSITIHFTNGKQFRFDRLTTHQLSGLIKEDLNDIIGKDVTVVAENSDLIIALIENNTYTIDELSYAFEVKKIVIAEQLQLNLHIRFAT